jgi:hypothetical protein
MYRHLIAAFAALARLLTIPCGTQIFSRRKGRPPTLPVTYQLQMGAELTSREEERKNKSFSVL